MRPHYFTANMKMADLIHTNHKLLFVFSRMNIKQGFGDRSVTEVCEMYDVPVAFFLMICNSFTFSDYHPDLSEILNCPVEALLDYLSRSHVYYLEYRLPNIDKSLRSLSFQSPRHAEMLQHFFSEYQKEVHAHMDYEDEVVFPYIRNLVHHQEDKQYSIHTFEEHHDDIETKLNDLKNILLKYLPEEGNDFERAQVLTNLFLLEDDLNNHSEMEEKILIPVVENLEKKSHHAE